MRGHLLGILKDAKVAGVFGYIEADAGRTIDEQCEIALIEAPPLCEGKRAADIARRLSGCGLSGAAVDGHSNAVALLPGRGGRGSILVEAHLDTVFPFGTVKGVTKEGGRFMAPGISDNCRGLAALLCIARAMRSAGISLEKDVVFAGTSGEEGLGDLKGMRGLFASGASKYDCSISIDGHGKGEFVFDATGSLRYEVAFETAGGHSWTDFGKPSAIHAMGRAISKLACMDVSGNPKTTFNVGIIKGGTAVNAIAQKASMTVDLRSESPQELESLDVRFKEAVRAACEDEMGFASIKADVSASVKKVGDRPAGRQPAGSLMPSVAAASCELLGIRQEISGPSSTNANIPISMGIPSLCMGAGGDGGGIHTEEEWFTPADGWKSVQQCALIIIACAGLE